LVEILYEEYFNVGRTNHGKNNKRRKEKYMNIYYATKNN
jgi:hypothetical protein